MFLLLLLVISAATACRDNDVFCFDGCSVTFVNVNQFCSCVVNEVVGRNDPQSLGNSGLISAFETQAEMILNNATGCTYCCSFIIIPQDLPQDNNTLGRVFILQFHCIEICNDTITKYWSHTGFLVPFRKEIMCMRFMCLSSTATA